MRSGMSLWMQAWTWCVVESALPPRKPPVEDESFPVAVHREVTLILAAMVLYGRQEARA
jgi:hypothetical protein